MSPTINRQWLLERRPRGPLERQDFRWVEASIPEPAEGEILVRNLCFSCDPAQKSWLTSDTYLPAVKIGEVVRAFAVGQVTSSRDPRYAPGQLVQGLFGLQDYAAVRDEPQFQFLRVPEGFSIETVLSGLGYTALTAYFGLLEIGRPQPGETVVVSAAAGATGSMVGQIAKIKGCRVVGIAGGPDKCRWLTDELGFDHVIDYKNDNVVTGLRKACPNGIDVYWDNVGGRILEAALSLIAMHARVVVCGSLSTYNSEGPASGPRNYMKLLNHRARMEGFVVLDYVPRVEEAWAVLGPWLREGRIKDRIDVQHGLEHAPEVLGRLFSGANQGKQLLKVADPIGRDA